MSQQNKSHGQKVEGAILLIGAWLIRGRYRHLLHSHNGFYRAVDEISKDRWDAESIVELAEQMTAKSPTRCPECGGDHEPSGARSDCVLYWKTRAIESEL